MTKEAKTTQELIEGGQEVLISGTSAGDDVPVSMGTGLDPINDGVRAYDDDYSSHYIAAPAADEVVKASAGYVKSVTLGAWVTGGTIEISDHASDGDGNVKYFLQAGATDESGFPKTVPVGTKFATGITVDTIGLTHVTINYR